jgi:hypothetical protein
MIQQTGILHFGEKLHNFSDMAALCLNLDLVICADTPVAHPAAAPGMTTWIVLPYVPDWRVTSVPETLREELLLEKW